MAYLPLSTSNLPNPAIDPAQNKEPRDYFETFIYTGNGGGLQVGDVIKKPADTTTISSSLIFNDDDSAYLSNTHVDGGEATYTLSVWVKRSTLGVSDAHIFGSIGNSGDDYELIRFDSNNNINWQLRDTTLQGNVTTTSAFKDTSTWYHLVFYRSGSTVKIYANGIEQTLTTGTSFSATTQWANSNTYEVRFGVRTDGASGKYDGYMAEVHFVDGTAYNADTFGNFDANGIWIPKTVTGITYGTNGFYLDFADNTNTTTLGADQTANGNDWTLSAGFATTDQVADSPTDNHVTFDTTKTGVRHVLSEGNLEINGSVGNQFNTSMTTTAVSTGKYYWEFNVIDGDNNTVWVGVANPDSTCASGTTQATTLEAAKSWNIYGFNGTMYLDGTSNTTFTGTITFGTGDLMMLAMDADTGKVWIGKNNSWFNSGNPAAGTGEMFTASGSLLPIWGSYKVQHNVSANFGQRSFSYTAPTGFVALSENNITVDDQNLENPDLVWIKNRDAADSHQWYDSVRGVQRVLQSDNVTNPVEADAPNGLVDFNANGFTIGSDDKVNTSGEDYVAWTWKFGGSPSATNSGGATPTSGSIMIDGTASTTTLATATMYPDKASVNSVSKCGVMTYTSPSTLTTGDTVANPFGFAPDVMFIKKLTGGAQDWGVYHKSIGNTGGVLLNESGDDFASVEWWNNTTPTSSLITLGRFGYVNNANIQHVCYAFSEVEGFSKFGTYSGNTNADGVFIYTGFRPAFIMSRIISGSGDWQMYDVKRDTYNVAYKAIWANYPNQEYLAYNNVWDVLSNGFKARTSSTIINSGTYIYMAFAENPFKYSNAR